MVGWGVGNHTFSVWKKINFVSFLAPEILKYLISTVGLLVQKEVSHSLTHSYVHPMFAKHHALWQTLYWEAKFTQGRPVSCGWLLQLMAYGSSLAPLCQIFHGQWPELSSSLPFVLCFQWLTDTWTIIVVCYISFQWLLSQITTSFVTHSNTNILSYILRSEAPI